MNFLGASLLISACLANHLAQIRMSNALNEPMCGDTRIMNCNEDCPETNGIRWNHYHTTSDGCCSSWGRCFGRKKHCRFDCASCAGSCPNGYDTTGGYSKQRAGSVGRHQDCGCHKQCKNEPCIPKGPWIYLFDGCPRGPGASSYSYKGWHGKTACQHMCMVDGKCVAIEVNGCLRNPGECGGACWHFYGDNFYDEIYNGNCVINGDQKAYRISTGRRRVESEDARVFVPGVKAEDSPAAPVNTTADRLAERLYTASDTATEEVEETQETNTRRLE